MIQLGPSSGSLFGGSSVPQGISYELNAATAGELTADLDFVPISEIATLLPPEPDHWSSKRARLLNDTTEEIALKLDVMLEGNLPHLGEVVHGSGEQRTRIRQLAAYFETRALRAPL